MGMKCTPTVLFYNPDGTYQQSDRIATFGAKNSTTIVHFINSLAFPCQLDEVFSG